jgi:two-component system OmpR family response regulator
MSLAKILIADDDAEIGTLLSVFLRNIGYEVITAVDGCQAVAFARRYEPDLLILDVNMPAGSGLSVHERIQKMQGINKRPVIYLTGDKSDRMLKTIQHMNPHRILHKPIESSELLLTVRTALEPTPQATGMGNVYELS